MRIYFLSAKTAALKLNGIYTGVIDSFERHVEMNVNDAILAEIVPDDNAEPVNFFINEDFFKDPPDCADVYLIGGDALVYIKKFACKNRQIEVIAQTAFCQNTVTLFSDGGLYLSCEGNNFDYFPLEDEFRGATFKQAEAGGFPLLILQGKGCIVALSAEGKKLFSGAAESCECGEYFEVCVPFETCARVKARITFSYDGKELKRIKSVTTETISPPDSTLHFAFFESVLTRGDSAKYLCEELKPKADELYSFLGDFTGVTVPTEKFYSLHGNMRAAGLVYPLKKNVYEIKYFAVDVEDGKIVNIISVDD